MAEVFRSYKPFKEVVSNKTESVLVPLDYHGELQDHLE